MRSARHLRLSTSEISDVTASMPSLGYFALQHRVAHPRKDILVRLATLYRVSTDYLLGMTNIRSLDLSGLSDEEVSAVSELVAIMTKRNEQLNSLL